MQENRISFALAFLKQYYSPKVCASLKSARDNQIITKDNISIRKIDHTRLSIKASQHKYRQSKHGQARQSGRNEVKRFMILALKHPYSICKECHKRFKTSELTVDHIIPLKQGGSNHAYNLQLLCKRCNSSKRDNIPAGMLMFDKV